MIKKGSPPITAERKLIMTIKEFRWDFHLFDGEGGGDAGEGTASSSESKQDVKTIQYGKSTGEDQTPSQVGSDDGNQAEDLEAEFAALIGKGGRFHDIYGQKVSDTVQSRFKNQTDYRGQVDQYNEALTPLFANYGLKLGDIEGLKAAVQNDENFYKSGAEKAGLDVDHYKEMLKLRADSERLSQINEAFQHEQARQAKYAEWEAATAELQEAFPAFDLALEIENNDEFAQLLDSGVDVRRAFLTTHMDEILNGANAYAQKAATANVVSTIQQRAARPMEGALNHAPAIQRKSDPSSLSNEDLDEINRRVANGEVVAF